MITTVMLTYERKFPKACRTLRQLSSLDLAILLVPKGEGHSLRRMLQQPGNRHRWVGPFPNYEIVEHTIESRTSDGLVRYGALKNYATDRLLAKITRPGDVGLLMDDDLSLIQGINVHLRDQIKREQPWRDKIAQERFNQKWRFLGPERQQILIKQYHFAAFSAKVPALEVRQRILKMARVAAGNYFTFAYTALPNNALIRFNEPTPWVKFSGVLGFTYGVPNPFNPDVNAGEDWDAQGRILCDLNRRILADPTTAFNMEIETHKYMADGALYHDRMHACDRATAYRFEGHSVFKKIVQTSLGKLPSVSVNRQVQESIRRAA